MKNDVKAFTLECYKVKQITGKRCNDIWVRRRVFKRRTLFEEGKKVKVCDASKAQEH